MINTAFNIVFCIFLFCLVVSGAWLIMHEFINKAHRFSHKYIYRPVVWALVISFTALLVIASYMVYKGEF